MGKKGYIVGFVEKKDKDFDLKIVNCVSDDFEKLADITEKHIDSLRAELNSVDGSGVYMLFGGRYKNADEFGTVAEYYIQEMRSDTIYVKYKIFEVEL